MQIVKSISSILLAILLSPLGANAGVIDFTNGECDGLAICVKSISGGTFDGTKATFSNPVTEDEASDNDFFNTVFGLALGSFRLGSTWDVVFDDSVEWFGGTIGFITTGTGVDYLGFDVSGAGVDEEALLAEAVQGQFTLNSPIRFLAGETYNFASINLCLSTGCGGIVFKTLEFGAPIATVPEPGTLALLCLGLIGMLTRRRMNG